LKLGRFLYENWVVQGKNGSFLQINHRDPHFLLYKFNQDSVPKAKKKKNGKIYDDILQSLKKSYEKGHLG